MTRAAATFALAVLALGAAGPAAAQLDLGALGDDLRQGESLEIREREPNLMGEAVKLRALDKVTARTFDYTVPLGETLEFGSLTIHARHCEKTPPTELPETYAFLQIDDRRLEEGGIEAEEGARLFSGWMFASRPAISALDHRVYDVWVTGCQTKPGVEDLRR